MGNVALVALDLSAQTLIFPLTVRALLSLALTHVHVFVTDMYCEPPTKTHVTWYCLESKHTWMHHLYLHFHVGLFPSLWHAKSLAVTKLTHVPWRPLTKAHCFNRLNAHRALSVHGEVKRWGSQKRTSSCTPLLISINLPPAPLNLGTLCPSLPPLPSSCQASLLQTDSISVAMRGCVSSLQTPATLPHWSPERLSCRWTVDQVHFDQKKRKAKSFRLPDWRIWHCRSYGFSTQNVILCDVWGIRTY